MKKHVIKKTQMEVSRPLCLLCITRAKKQGKP